MVTSTSVKAVYGFHVAACRYPYHFCEWLRDCSGDKVYLILADFAGREYNTLSLKVRFSCRPPIYSVVPKWCPVLQNHLIRRYGKINDDMRKTLILSHFRIGFINTCEGL